MCEGRTVDVMVVLVRWSELWKGRTIDIIL
jgi:hypothetical protein